MYYNALELFNQYLHNYFDKYKAFSNARKRKLGNKYDLIISLLETYNYDVWFENEEPYDMTRKTEKHAITRT